MGTFGGIRVVEDMQAVVGVSFDWVIALWIHLVGLMGAYHLTRQAHLAGAIPRERLRDLAGTDGSLLLARPPGLCVL